MILKAFVELIQGARLYKGEYDAVAHTESLRVLSTEIALLSDFDVVSWRTMTLPKQF